MPDNLTMPDWLPVTSADGKLVGVVERSALLADLILELDERLKGIVAWRA